MPYVGGGSRALVDGLIGGIVDQVDRFEDPVERDGLVEYVLYQVLRRLYFGEGSRFFDMNRGVGLLETTKRSLERDWLDPYEQRKLAERWSE